MDSGPKIGENALRNANQKQSVDDIVGNNIYDTVGDTIVTPFQTPNKAIPVMIPKIDKRNYKKNSKLRFDDSERIKNVKRKLIF